MALTFLYEKKAPIVTKPPYQKVSVQLAQLKKPEPIKKIVNPIEKPIEELIKIEKPIITKKQVFKKPIKKKAKRKLVKKTIKKPVKKVTKKKITKKKIVKKKPIKKVVKKTVEKKVEKIVEKAPSPIQKKEKAAKKTLAKSLAQFKKFKTNYKNTLRAAIDRNKKYPIASKRLGEQGLVIVSFRVLKSGIFKNIKLITSSGKKRLDKAALKALIKTAKFKPFTKDINKEYMDLTVPIKFKIN